MKPAISIFLGFSCLTLAFALFWNGVRNGKHAAESPATADFSPALPKDDVTLLDRPVGDLELPHVSLEEAARIVAERSKITISVDWQTLADVNVTPKTDISLKLKNAVLADALEAIQVIAVLPTRPLLGYHIEDGIVTLTSFDESIHRTTHAYFNIRPLVEEILAYSDKPVPNGKADHLVSREEVIEQITKLVTDLVAPDSWRDAGGSVGSIRVMGGVMVVEQSLANVREIRILLERMHQAMLGHDFPPFSRLAEPAMQPKTVPASGDDSPQRETPAMAYFNIRSLILDLNARNPDFPPPDGPNGLIVDAGDKIEGFIESTVSPESWQENGGPGVITYLGGVLYVQQTPANIAAVQIALRDLHAAILRDEFGPATRPAATTTR